MSDVKYISRKPKKGDSYGFYDFRKRGIDMLQKLSGNIWTDYNVHDPGITILEQCCYALTELVYKSQFQTEDYLTGKNGQIDFENLALYMPWEVFPSEAITNIDKRKVLLDQVHELINVWIVKSQVNGVFDILMDIPDEYHQSNDRVDRIKSKVRKVFNKHRSLCENIGDINILGSEKINVAGSIEMKEGHEPEEVLADIFFHIKEYFSPGYQRVSYKEIENQTNDLSKIFNGPLLENGFIPNCSLKSSRKEISMADLTSSILKVEGVINITNIYFEKQGKRLENLLKFEEVNMSPGFVTPTKKEELKIRLTKSGRRLAIDLNKTNRYFKKKQVLSNIKYNNLNDIQHYLHVNPGVFRQFSEHYSIQNDFPDTYGIGENGVSDAYEKDTFGKIIPERKRRVALAKQLKAYLTIFDQLMVNYLNQVQNIKNIYSLNTSNHSYYFHELYRGFLYSEEIYVKKKNIDKHFNGIQDQIDHSIKRKHELLDYMIGLYGDKLDLDPLYDFDYYSDNLKLKTIQLKTFFLKNILWINQRKGMAANSNSKDKELRNASGFLVRSLLELGISNFSQNELSDVFSNYGLKLKADEEYYKGAQDNHKITFSYFEDDIIDFYDVKAISIKSDISLEFIKELEKEFYPLKRGDVNTSLLRFGVNLGFYKMGKIKETDFFTVVFKSPSDDKWQNLGKFKTQHQAMVGVNKLQKLLIHLNHQSEGVHLVENILLRSKSKKIKYNLLIHTQELQLTFSFPTPLPGAQMEELKKKIYQYIKHKPLYAIERLENAFTYMIELFIPDLKLSSINVYGSYDDARQELDQWFLLLEKITYDEFCEKYLQFEEIEGQMTEPSQLTNRVSLFLPSWTSRFYNSKFRIYAEGVFRKNCPAHICPEFYWLDYKNMKAFESHHKKWKESIQKAKKEQTDELSLKLLQQIESYNSA